MMFPLVHGLFPKVSSTIVSEYTLRQSNVSRNYPRILSYNGKIYSHGGFVGASEDGNIYEYDPVTNTWITFDAAIASTTKTYGHTFVEVNGKFHIIGGYDDGSYLANHFEYDPAVKSLTSKPAIPVATMYNASAVVGDDIYVIGGILSGPITDNVYAYDTVANSWSLKAPLPVALRLAMAGVVNGLIYVWGGIDTNSARNLTMYVYDPVLNTWTDLGTSPPEIDGAYGRHRPTSLTISCFSILPSVPRLVMQTYSYTTTLRQDHGG